MLSIGKLNLDSWAVMAPMAGITNLPFRVIVRKMGAGLVTSEMVSAAGLTRAHKKTLNYLKTDPAETPLSVQLFGSKPEIMAEAAKITEASGAHVIDINMGCPARKVLKTGSGGALMRDPYAVRDIVTAVRKACKIPLTVKMRAGWSKDDNSAVRLAQIMEDCGVDAITLHPRSVSQGFSGKADWDLIKVLKETVDIPVIGNGDIFDFSLAFEMRTKTGCDGVMIGRGAVENPWIFRQISLKNRGFQVTYPEIAERRALIEEHFRLLCRFMGEERAARAMRGLLLWYTKGLPDSCRFRGTFTGIRNFEDMMSAVKQYFSKLEG